MRIRHLLTVLATGAALFLSGCGGGGSGDAAAPAAPAEIRFFAASDGVNGFELWKTDGTPQGTVQVTGICAAPCAGSFPGAIRVLNGSLSFFAEDGANGRELWRSDGTPQGTVRVKDICPGPCGGVL